MTRTLRAERGAAMVEAPFAIAILLLLGLAVTTVVQLVWTHLDLASAARDATRYAARVEYDPSATPVTASRFRTEDQIRSWTVEVAQEAGVRPADVIVGAVDEGGSAVPLTALRTGDKVTVTIRTLVSNPLYRVAAGVSNGAAAVLHAGQAFDPEGLVVQAEASTYVE